MRDRHLAFVIDEPKSDSCRLLMAMRSRCGVGYVPIRLVELSLLSSALLSEH